MDDHQQMFIEQIKEILDSGNFSISKISYEEIDEEGEPAVVEIRLVRTK